MGITPRILLVDDNHVQSATRRAILESCGREVAIALNGRQALDQLMQDSEAGHPFALVVTDHLMPVMSGPELVTELRQQGFELPVIVLSGLPDAEMAYEGLDVIFQLKPCNPDTLIALVQDLLGECMRRSA